MKKLFLIKNPELFQGEKNLKMFKSYFEGWYFKNTNKNTGISFIPGISITKDDKKAFIQIITNDSSYYVNYSIDDFEFNNSPFYIKIGNNIFSKDNLHIDINEDTQNLNIYGNINYSNTINIRNSTVSPNIMGPFSYLSFMECNHAILSMKSRADGIITINNHNIEFNDDIGYIEKDWGCSFPKSYIWCQGNNFQNKNTSFMLSIADIPFKIFHFTGVICSLIIDDKEYRFATYNGSKIVKYDINDNRFNITLKHRHYILEICVEDNKSHNLVAPIKGNMEKNILESISATVTITLKKDQEIIFNDTSINCGLEIVK